MIREISIQYQILRVLPKLDKRRNDKFGPKKKGLVVNACKLAPLNVKKKTEVKQNLLAIEGSADILSFNMKAYYKGRLL